MQLDPYSRATSVLIALALSASICVGQTQSAGDASVEVIVRDPSGALIRNARVQLFKNGKRESTTQTNEIGEGRFNRIVVGRYRVHVEAPGFKGGEIDTLELHAGLNRTEVTLEIEPIKADVEVSEEARVKNSNPNGRTFTNVLTADQIAQLPDDPDELEDAINQLAGPGAQIRVNGFRGGKLPPEVPDSRDPIPAQSVCRR